MGLIICGMRATVTIVKARDQSKFRFVEYVFSKLDEIRLRKQGVFMKTFV